MRWFRCGGFVAVGCCAWRLIGRVLRTLGGKYIGKCRLRAHQHPLLPPLSNQRGCKLPPTYLQSGSSNERMLKIACCMHRFLISGPDLRIDARFSPFTSSCVHRFLISSPDLRIDARFSPFTPSGVHRFLISCPDLGIDAGFSLFKPSFVHRFLILGPDLGIDAWFCLFTPSCVHRFLISCPDLGIDAWFCLETTSILQ